MSVSSTQSAARALLRRGAEARSSLSDVEGVADDFQVAGQGEYCTEQGSGFVVVSGDMWGYLPPMEASAQLVTDHLQHRQPHPDLVADADPVFQGPNHSRLTRSGMAKLIARHSRAVRACNPDWAPNLPVTPHTLRRNRAIHLAQAGINLIYIRDLLGHADVSTTQIYARADGETKRKAIENAHEPLTPETLPDWTLDSSQLGWL